MLNQARLLVLVALLGAAACNPEEDPFEFPGPIDPCDVEPAKVAPSDNIAREGWSDDDGPFGGLTLSERGPFSIWMTSPTDECGDDISIGQIGEADARMQVVYPAADEPTETGESAVARGTFPVVVFGHANNDRECDIYRRYRNMTAQWASWGFIVLAIDGTATNCNRGTKENIELRRDGMLAGYRTIKELNADPTSPFYGRVDESRVVWAGHSRGGGAAILAAMQTEETIGIIDLQGVDITAFGFGADPIDPIPTIGFTAREDVDLNFPHVEPTEDQLSGEYTWVDIGGAIHAHTADTVPIEPDDEPLVTRDEQQSVTHMYSTAFLLRHAGAVRDATAMRTDYAAAHDVLFSYDGAERALALSVLGVYQRWNRRVPGDILIDDFDSRLDGEDSDINELGTNISEGLAASDDVATYKPEDNPASGHYGKAQSRRLEANGEGSFTLRFAEPTGANHRALSARVKGPREGDVASFRVELMSGDEVLGSFEGGEHTGPIDLTDRMTQLEVPLPGEDIDAVRFIITDGTLFIDDVRLSL